MEADRWFADIHRANTASRSHESGRFRLRAPEVDGDSLVVNAQAASGARIFVKVRRYAGGLPKDRAAGGNLRPAPEKPTPGLALLDSKGTIVTANGALSQMLGGDVGPLTGRHAADLLPVPAPGTWRFCRDAADGQTDSTPTPVPLRIGHHAFTDAGDGHEAPSILMVEDGSEIQELEDQITCLSKLTALGEMTASIAHEINQPLNTARLVAEAALAELADNQDDARAPRHKSIIDHSRPNRAHHGDHSTCNPIWPT